MCWRFVESIWHTELGFMVPHRDRLVILSFTTSPYQNNSVHEENHIKQFHRPMFIEDDDELAHTHLIEKFHSGSFDENDYFDTHEKLENEKTTSPITTPAPVTAPNNANNYDRNKISTKATSIETNDKQIYAENGSVATMNVNNRKQHARMRNRNNNGTTGGRGTNRKSTNANKERANDNNGNATGRRDKNNRRADDLRENFETKVNNKLDFDKNNGEFGERNGQPSGVGGSIGGANGKSSRKYATKIDTTDELLPDTEYEWNGNRKVPSARDSNIHIVKPAEGTFVPSTPFSTDSKIIEIKPSTIRTSKRNKRSSETIDTRLRIESDRYEDEFADITDQDIVEPKIYVNFENNEQYTENDNDNLLKPAPDTGGGAAAIAAALIDTSVPANVTAITTTTKQLHGFAGCLQHYLNVNKEIGKGKSTGKCVYQSHNCSKNML